MLIATSPLPATSSLQTARTLLTRAQGVAANASNEPRSSSYNGLLAGARAAKTAAELLTTATPESKFQNLKLASEHARSAQQALADAAVARDSDFGGAIIADAVRTHARTAFSALENALEILDNN